MNPIPKRRVVDTNVPIIANNQSPLVPESEQFPSPRCVINCVDAILDSMKRGTVAIDDDWRILNEYGNHLSNSGQPGVGDAFYKWLMQNHANPKRCVKVTVTTLPGTEENYAEFPAADALKSFDPSDRKFVAVANKCRPKPCVLQASDSKWWDKREDLEQAGIQVVFLCEADVQDFAARRA